MTCARVRDALAAGLPMDAVLEHVDGCFECQFYLENLYHARDLKVEMPETAGAALARDPRDLSCEAFLQRAAEEEFPPGAASDPHARRCPACLRTLEAFEAYRRTSLSVVMPVRLRRRLESLTQERGVSVLGRILPYVAAILLSLGLSLLLITKGNFSQEVVRLQERAVQTRGAAVSTYGKVVGYFARNIDKEEPPHEMRQP